MKKSVKAHFLLYMRVICIISPLLRSLVHLIHNDVCDAFEVCLALQSPQ